MNLHKLGTTRLIDAINRALTARQELYSHNALQRTYDIVEKADNEVAEALGHWVDNYLKRKEKSK